MLPDVRIKIQDGGLGLLPASLAGIQAKVGVCSLGTINEIVILSAREQIVDKLGTGPLVDACFDAFVAGASIIYAVKADGDIAGTISAITKTKTGSGDMTVAGTPLDSYQVIIQIVDAGNLNTATFKYSPDGGDTYSQKVTVPSAGNYSIPDTGITVTFTTGTGTSFAAGDQYTFTTQAPGASINSMNDAIDVLLASNLEYEFTHIVGPSDDSVWAALATRSLEAENNFRYLHFVAEARGPEAAETVDQWVTALLAMAADFASTRVSIVAARIEIVDDNTGLIIDRSGAGIYTGWLSKLPVQSSPGKVIEGSLPAITKLNPAGINDGHILALDEAGFVTFRQYTGLSGFYITNGRMKSEPISDYRYVETRRTMDKLCRNSRMAALRFEHAEASTEGIDALEANIQMVIDQMISDKEITSGKVTIPRDQNILATSKINVTIRVVPVPIMREIAINIGYENPFLTGK